MRTATLALCVLLSGCLLPTAPKPPTFVNMPDQDPALYTAACTHLRDMHCEEGAPYYDNDKPGPKGVPNATCEDLFERQQKNGVFLNPRCLVRVPTCDQIEAWRKKDCSAL